MSALSAPSLQAQIAVEDAFNKFKQCVTDNDARDFNNSTLGDVVTVARNIETELAARGSLRNAARLRPFFNGLEHYSKAVEVLCNGTPFLPWIWVRPDPVFLHVPSYYRTDNQRDLSNSCYRLPKITSTLMRNSSQPTAKSLGCSRASIESALLSNTTWAFNRCWLSSIQIF